MPVPLPQSPYDSILDDVLNLVRTRLNDAIVSLGGEVFTDEAVWSQTASNGGWRRLQEFMASKGSPRFVDTAIISGIPVAQGGNTPLDPGLQANISWDGYFDGKFFFPAPSLPRGMIAPIRLWERITNNANPARFTQMEPITQGTAATSGQSSRNGWWEWRNNAIYIPGATSITDIQVRFSRYLPDFINEGAVSWNQQPVPIMRAKDALAWYIASEVAGARGDMDAATFDTKAEAAATQLLTREALSGPQRQQWISQAIPAPTGNTNYDPLIVALQFAQVRLNAINKAAGDFLEASQEWTQQASNGAWRKIEEALTDLKFSGMRDEIAIPNVPALTSTDPTSYTALGWSGFWNGTAFIPAPVLPQLLVRPLRVWERQTGSNATWTPMELNSTGLGSQQKQQRNYEWQWEGDTIRMPGSTVAMDLRIEFLQAFPDFVQSGNMPWYMQQIPISRCADALAWYICAEVAASVQGNPDIDPNGLLTPESFAGRGEAALKLLVSRDAQAIEERGEWTIPDFGLPTTPTPYDYASTIMNAARHRLNAIRQLAGDVISMGKPFTQTYFNTAYRRLQEFLANLGYLLLTDRYIVTGLTPTTNLDPASQCYISWNGYFDGTTLFATKQYQLPQNFMFPLEIAERITGQNARFVPMRNAIDGLQSRQKQVMNSAWEWRADAIYFPGALQTEDLQIRFALYQPDLVNGATPWYWNLVPITRCLDALSLFICAEVAMARPDLGLDAAALRMEAEEKARLIFNRDTRANQRVNMRRRPRSGTGNRMGWFSYTG